MYLQATTTMQNCFKYQSPLWTQMKDQIGTQLHTFLKTFMRIVLTLMICTAVSCRFFNNFSPRLLNWFLPFLQRISLSPSGYIAARCSRCCNRRLKACIKHGITKLSFFSLKHQYREYIKHIKK